MSVRARQQERRHSRNGAAQSPRSLRVSIVHSHYASAEPSGENTAVAGHVGALQRAGHHVQLVAQRTDERMKSRLYPISAALTVASGIGPSPLQAIAEFRPDVIHVHNLFPNFGSRWIRKLETPIVHTLHNFRPICAAGTLFRDGQICTKCPDGDRWAGVRHGCYRGSRAKTLPLSIASHDGPEGDELLRSAAAIVVLSERSRSVYEAAGVPAEKLVCIPNFLADDLTPRISDFDGGKGWLFVGRLSPEKGIDRLVRRWPEQEQLAVVGEGQLKSDLHAAARGKRVEIVGGRSRTEILHLMQSSVGLVFPSRWYEGFPIGLRRGTCLWSARTRLRTLGCSGLRASRQEWLGYILD